MNFLEKIKNSLTDPLGAFKVFERIIAISCVTMPLFLRLADKDCSHFRSSIRQYFSMSNSYIYGMCICIPAMLFIFNGAVYFKSERELDVNPEGKWYNVILGFSLLCVIIFNPRQFHTAHLIFGAIFFLGNAVVIGFFQRECRALGRVLALSTVATFIFWFVFGLVSLLVAEWISLAVIAIHFFLEAKGVFSLTQQSQKV
jgi:hypothetical protein